MALGILRLPNGLDYSKYGKITDIVDCMTENGITSNTGFLHSSYASINLSKTDLDLPNGHNGSNTNLAHSNIPFF